MELSETAPVLHAIAIVEASDEPLDVPGTAAELEVSRVLAVDPVAPTGMHADMPASATALTMRQVSVRSVRGGIGWAAASRR